MRGELFRSARIFVEYANKAVVDVVKRTYGIKPQLQRRNNLDAPASPPAGEPTPQGNEKSSVPVDEPMPKGDETSPTPESPASTAVPPKTQRRSNEFWLAVLGVVATTLGVFVGAVTTFFTGVEGDKQENMRAQTSFTRGQHVAAYTALANAYSDLKAALIYKRDTILEKHPDFTLKYAHPKPKQDLETSYANYLDALNTIVFVGSSAVNYGASHVAFKAAQLRDFYLEWNTTIPIRPASPNWTRSGIRAIVC